MDWLRRIGGSASSAPPESEETTPGAVEGAAPGIAALFDGVEEDGTHSVLDLGPATDSKLRVYGRFARRMRFVDLLAAATPQTLRGIPPLESGTPENGWAGAMGALEAQEDRPYDLIFAWDILDRIPPEERPRLVERLAAVGAANARLHVVVEASERPTAHPLRFTLLGVDRIRYEAVGPARPSRPRIHSAEVERLLAPFQVVRAFTLKVGLREYVAILKDG
jgi:hypothetical protein